MVPLPNGIVMVTIIPGLQQWQTPIAFLLILLLKEQTLLFVLLAGICHMVTLAIRAILLAASTISIP